MSHFLKLFDNNGAPVADPKIQQGAVSWRINDAKAQAFSVDGKLIGELHKAQILWIEAGGIRFSGFEPTSPDQTSYRAQEWHYVP